MNDFTQKLPLSSYWSYGRVPGQISHPEVDYLENNNHKLDQWRWFPRQKSDIFHWTKPSRALLQKCFVFWKWRTGAHKWLQLPWCQACSGISKLKETFYGGLSRSLSLYAFRFYWCTLSMYSLRMIRLRDRFGWLDCCTMNMSGECRYYQ